jgi:hypothetical protein
MEEQRGDSEKQDFPKADEFHGDSPGSKAAENKPRLNRSAEPEKAEAMSRAEFPKRRTGFPEKQVYFC